MVHDIDGKAFDLVDLAVVGDLLNRKINRLASPTLESTATHLEGDLFAIVIQGSISIFESQWCQVVTVLSTAAIASF